MEKKNLIKFKKILLEERQRVMNSSRRSLDEFKVDSDDLPDETDLAVTEINQSLALKLRDRERLMLSKINEALLRIEDGSFGVCMDCEEPIEPKRLEVRPVSTLCIACKERQEHREKVFA